MHVVYIVHYNHKRITFLSKTDIFIQNLLYKICPQFGQILITF